jgi:hypothetical protein
MANNSEEDSGGTASLGPIHWQCKLFIEACEQTGKQADRETSRQGIEQTGKQADRQASRQANEERGRENRQASR